MDYMRNKDWNKVFEEAKKFAKAKEDLLGVNLKTKREDGYIVITNKRSIHEYETIIVPEQCGIKVIAYYNTKEAAMQGHEAYSNMSTYAIAHLESIE